VSESGLRDRATISRLESHGVAAFLIGESLMREPDIGVKLDELRGVGEELPSR
jgi:indole-3-glycerol phosphate synthase